MNHKNFMNLLGFCAEDSPFSRMMVFEYAPNGTLFEHLHSEYLSHFKLKLVKESISLPALLSLKELNWAWYSRFAVCSFTHLSQSKAP